MVLRARLPLDAPLDATLVPSVASLAAGIAVEVLAETSLQLTGGESGVLRRCPCGGHRRGGDGDWLHWAAGDPCTVGTWPAQHDVRPREVGCLEWHA